MKPQQNDIPAAPYYKDRFYPVHGVASVVGALLKSGAPAEALLRGSGITEEGLLLPSTKVSYDQLRTLIRNSAAMSFGRTAVLKAGISMHFTSLGIWGLGLKSTRTFRESAEFSVKYQWILGPLAASRFTASTPDGNASWTYDPLLTSDPSNPGYRMAVEIHLGLGLTLTRDCQGEHFVPSRVTFTYPAPKRPEDFSELLGCPVLFEQPTNSMFFANSWVSREVNTANAVTLAMAEEYCENLLAEISSKSSIDLQVRRFLLEHAGSFPTLEDVSSRLNVDPRTLRRQLQFVGTSYNDLLDEIRKNIALKYLRETSLTQDEIANRLGFSDGSNFRKAFKRWTNHSPGTYRQGSPKH